MRVSSEEWTEKYRPKRLSAVVGNEKAIEDLREWADELARPKSKKAALLHGPAGCGKTSAAYALAAERGWEVIELNASDQRNEGVIRSIVGPASSCTTFSQQTRLIILDEADNLHGSEDRGGTKAITEIVKQSTQPIILTANDKYKVGGGLTRNCRVIAFERIKAGMVFRVLRRISEERGLAIENNALIALAKNAHGDLRSAINDLQALAMTAQTGERISAEEIVTGGRDREEDIFGVLRLIFSTEDRGLQEVLAALYSLDKTPEESIQWVYKNFAYTYDDARFLHGLEYLSRADLYLGRVRQRENYKFWRYASGLMAGSMLSAQAMKPSGGPGWNPPGPRYFKSPWQRARLPDEAERASGPMDTEIAAKIAQYVKVPQSHALSFILPFLPIFFEDDRKAAEITAALRLDVPEIATLVREGEKERAERIYQAARALMARRVAERRVEGPQVVMATVKEEKRIKKRDVELVDEIGKGDDMEVKNQRMLTDFF
jgi:replication factor C large subunit